MTHAASIPQSAAGRHSLIPTAVLLLVVAGLSWDYDAPLLLRLRLIANDTFAIGNPDMPGLLMDGSDELRAYPPARLVEFIRFPAPQIRAVALLALGDRVDDLDERAWVGVAPRLIDAFVGESDGVVRECARSALLNLPCVPAEDGGYVLALIEDSAPDNDAMRELLTELMDKVLRARPELLPRMVALYGEWLASADVETRRAAFDQLAARAPAALETLAAFQRIMKGGDPDGIAAKYGRRLLAHHPNLIDDCLKGNAAQRKFILECAPQESQARANRRPRTLETLFTETGMRVR